MMPPNRTQTQGISSLRFPCPYCPRRFGNPGGRTQHIRAKHSPDGPEPQQSLSPSPLRTPPNASLSHDSLLEQSPFSQGGFSANVNMDIEDPNFDRVEDQVPSSPGGFDADVDIDIENLNFNRDETPPGSYIRFGQELNGSLSPRDGARERRVRNPPPVTRIYHSKLNGK